MIAGDWTPHRRDDGEQVGWIRPEGDLWVAIDVLGREVGSPQEWLEAEAALEERGLAWLGDVWVLEREGSPGLRVRIVEVSPDGVVVKTDDFGAIDAPVDVFRLGFPAPPSLRLLRPGEDTGASPFTR